MLIVRNIRIKIGEKIVIQDVSLSLAENRLLVIAGPAGSGKTILGMAICGLVPIDSGEITRTPGKTFLMVGQHATGFLAWQNTGYYGQRYENIGLDEVPSVMEFMQKELAKLRQTDAGRVSETLREMGALHLAHRKLAQLSSGERKRVQMAAALLQNPDVLVLDQPFAGLDTVAAQNLAEFIYTLCDNGKSVVVLGSSEHVNRPNTIILELGNNSANLPTGASSADETALAPNTWEPPEKMPQQHADNNFSIAVKMVQANVTYGNTKILSNIDWAVMKGERWALLGHNGAGKSTLLSLITADNPQGYSNNLILFDRKRGSGESIWDIKNRIGFVSPEQHLYFLRGGSINNTVPGIGRPLAFAGKPVACVDVIASGLIEYGTSSGQGLRFGHQAAAKWMSAMQLAHLSGSWFHEVSLGEQRLILLARALVKYPSLLVLDEPCQGLNTNASLAFSRMLDTLCTRLGTTMVYATHRPSEIPACVTQLLRLDNGMVAFNGKYRRETNSEIHERP